ncbi:SSI family serine proteinase inhibitor [Saccharomonospora sp. NPDC006951]
MPMFAAGSVAACAITMVCATGPAPASHSALTLTLQTTDGAARTVQLNCDPASGTHPKAEEACAALSEADGKFGSLVKTSVACPMIYAPLEATARGHWQGSPVDYSTEYANSCVAGAESEGVFAF